MMLLSAQAVDKVEFKTVHLAKGYDIDEVDSFLDQIVDTLKELYSQLGDYSSRPTVAMPAVSARTAESLIEAAHRQADHIEAEANGKAGAILADARNQADEVERKAKQQADVITGGAFARKDELNTLVEQLTKQRDDISAALTRALEGLKS